VKCPVGNPWTPVDVHVSDHDEGVSRRGQAGVWGQRPLRRSPRLLGARLGRVPSRENVAGRQAGVNELGLATSGCQAETTSTVMGNDTSVWRWAVTVC
jgi:hypothetical protein